MSLGNCSFFGLSISLSGTEVYPYVVVIIGLENTLIIVKAVMSTPEELEVKHRITTGLSKEGQVLMKNVLTPSLLLGIGVLAFNYTMKEFCIIALVGLLCDSFLQLVFFLTILSIDLRRMEVSQTAVTVVVSYVYIDWNVSLIEQCYTPPPSSLILWTSCLAHGCVFRSVLSTNSPFCP